MRLDKEINFASSTGNWASVVAYAEKYKSCAARDAEEESNLGSALLNASEAREVAAVWALLQAGASINYKSPRNGYTCLHYAAYNNDVRMIEVLLRNGASLIETNHDGTYPFGILLQNEYWGGINAILDEKTRGKNIDLHEQTLSRILNAAIKANQLNTIARIEKTRNCNNLFTPIYLKEIFHWAVEKNNIPIIKLLLKHDVKQTTKNNKGQTAVALASALGHWNCVQALIEHTDTNTERGLSQEDIEKLQYEELLINAVKRNQYAIVELLLKQGTPCTRWNSEFGNILLYFALENNNAQIFQLLLHYNADPYASNSRGETIFETANSLKNKLISNKCIPILEQIKRTEPKVMKMEQYLKKLREKISIDNIEGKAWGIPWQVKNFWGGWTDGTPKHIQQLKNCLHKTNLSSNEIIKTFAKVKFILSSIQVNPRRDIQTQKFYDENLKTINLLELELNEINNNFRLSVYNSSERNQAIFNNATISQTLLNKSSNDRKTTISSEKMASLNKQVANNFPLPNNESHSYQSVVQSPASSRLPTQLYPNILALKHGRVNETEMPIKENYLARETSSSNNAPVAVTLNYPDIHKYQQLINEVYLDQDVSHAAIKNEKSTQNPELDFSKDLEKKFLLQENLQDQASAPHVRANELGFFKAHNKEKKSEPNTNFKRKAMLIK